MSAPTRLRPAQTDPVARNALLLAEVRARGVQLRAKTGRVDVNLLLALRRDQGEIAARLLAEGEGE